MKAKIQKCSTKIWKKFTLPERQLWEILYETFLLAENYPSYMAGKGPKDKMMRAVVAHNLACQAIWKIKDWIK